jgi:hypothetical protein
MGYQEKGKFQREGNMRLVQLERAVIMILGMSVEQVQWRCSQGMEPFGHNSWTTM